MNVIDISIYTHAHVINHDFYVPVHYFMEGNWWVLKCKELPLGDVLVPITGIELDHLGLCRWVPWRNGEIVETNLQS